jgi:hypothetical protein
MLVIIARMTGCRLVSYASDLKAYGACVLPGCWLSDVRNAIFNSKHGGTNPRRCMFFPAKSPDGDVRLYPVTWEHVREAFRFAS